MPYWAPNTAGPVRTATNFFAQSEKRLRRLLAWGCCFASKSLSCPYQKNSFLPFKGCRFFPPCLHSIWRDATRSFSRFDLMDINKKKASLRWQECFLDTFSLLLWRTLTQSRPNVPVRYQQYFRIEGCKNIPIFFCWSLRFIPIWLVIFLSSFVDRFRLLKPLSVYSIHRQIVKAFSSKTTKFFPHHHFNFII